VIATNRPHKLRTQRADSAVLDRVCSGGGRRAMGSHFAESSFAPFAGVALVRRSAQARIADE
jgi:hypothetical protein